MSKKTTKKKHRFLRRLLRILAGIFVFLLCILLFIRSPWGQQIIVDKAINYITDKTNTKLTVDKVYLTFGGNLQVDNLYAADTKGDTLVYSKSLEADLPLWKMINGEAFGVESLEAKGLVANIIRKDSISGYNFQFFLDAFAPDSTATKTAPKDTVANPITIILKDLDIKNANVVFNDAIIGIKSSYKVGSLTGGMNRFDIDSMYFFGNDLRLLNSNINIAMFPVPSSSTEASTPLPLLSANSLQSENTFVKYTTNTESYTTNISKLYAEIPQMDIEKFVYEFDAIQLNDSNIEVAMSSFQETNIEATTNNGASSALENAVAKLNNINLKNNSISYRLNNEKLIPNEFNPNAFKLNHFSLLAEELSYQNDNAKIAVQQASFKTASGFQVQKFSTYTTLSETNLNAENFSITTNKSSLKGNFYAEYDTLQQFIDAPDKILVSLAIPEYSIVLSDFYVFNPALKNNSYVYNLGKQPLSGNVFTNGNLSKISIENLETNWGNNTNIKVEGTLQNPTDIEKFSVDLPKIDIVASRTDLKKLIDEEQFGIRFPNRAQLKGYAQFSQTNAEVDLNLNTTLGTVSIDGFLQNNENIKYDINLKLDDYNVGQLLQNPQLKTVSLTVNSEGNGTNFNNLDASLQVNVPKLQLENYTVKGVEINGIVNNGSGNVTSTYKDENLNMSLDAFVDLDSINTIAKTNINIVGADLQALGVMQRNVKTGMEIESEFKGNLTKYNAKATITNGVFVYDNRTYLLGNLSAKAFVNKDTTAVSLDNRLINLNLASNTDPQTFANAIQKHISSYFNKKQVNLDTIKNPVNLQLDGRIAQAPLLNEVFLLNVKDLDTIDLAINFIEKERILDANITIPHINYMDYEVDSLVVNVNTDHEDIRFDFGFKNILAGPFDVPKTVISGVQKNDSLAINFSAIDDSKKLVNTDIYISGERDSLSFSINDKSLLINGKNWQIPSNNSATYTNKKLTFTNFNFSNNNQQVAFLSNLENIENDHIALTYGNFKLKELFNYLNPEQQLVKGTVNGEFIIENPFANSGIIADASVSNLTLVNTDFGTMSLEAKSLESNHYNFSTQISGGVTKLNLNGDYFVENNDAMLNMQLAIENFDMKALETLSFGEIKKANGQLTGNFSISEKLSNPQYKGEINFLDASITAKKLNTQFTLVDEKLSVNNDGLQLNNFKVLDAENNQLSLSGKIGTATFANPTFDVTLKAKDFHVLNAKKEDNASFYGNASFDATAKLTGDLNIPKLDATLTIGKGTDFYYVMPATYAGIEERDNVVVFVNRKNPNAILTQTEEQTAIVTGFDISAKLKTTKEAAFTIIIDENTGDNFKVAGNADLNLGINPQGDLSLAGVFTADRGHYELNLYDLVNKKFSLVKGSQVTWSGDPFDAKLDVRALYKVETSASSLMASRISGADATVANQFRQQLPFLVYLSIDGELMQPEISFTLDMPEEQQGALGGEVFARVQEVNNQEEELNKQVFSLLVLNRFYPTPGSDGSSGGFATVARDNLNDAVASQLNTFSSKILGNTGLNLDFGLNSFTDYQGSSANDRTQLEVAAEKKLFNDRFTVRVGSEIDVQGSDQTGQDAPLIGNVSLIYQLTEDGRYQIKGFRTSEYENVIDGQTIVSGIALTFNKEFNKFSQLWNSIFKLNSKQEGNNEK